MTSREARTDLVKTLELDLIGPSSDHPCASELLSSSPLQWYLHGFLVPMKGGDQIAHEQEDDGTELDTGFSGGTYDDDAPVDRSASSQNILPASMGISTLIPQNAKTVKVTIEWGDYTEEKLGTGTNKFGYRRSQKCSVVEICISDLHAQSQTKYVVPNSTTLDSSLQGLALSCIARPMPKGHEDGLPPRTKSLTLFLVNERILNMNHSYRSCIFQVKMKIHCEQGLVGRPDLRGLANHHRTEADLRLADLHFRDVVDYGTGHGVSVCYDTSKTSRVKEVESCWHPKYEVERVVPSDIGGVEFSMKRLGELSVKDEVEEALLPLIAQYQDWLNEQQEQLATLSPISRRDKARDLIAEARSASDRIEEGIRLIGSDEKVFTAFRLANQCMFESAKRRLTHLKEDQISWRPFQLAFILLNLKGLVDDRSAQRSYVELLFFPTGGGKTEAYLGLAAFQLLYRRLIHPGMESCGVSVLMRYTLRLLTLDQMGRAAALICALELQRRRMPDLFGAWPFEIGLWVGSASTPNRLGGTRYDGPAKEHTAHAILQAYQQNPQRYGPPVPLECCPWCEEKFTKDSFSLVPNPQTPTHLAIICQNYDCEFSQGQGLPILTVDETIYRRLPCFIIATVDKFAALPWEGRAGALFGRVQRFDHQGFYGTMEPSMGTPMNRMLPGPDLIIQDELHLISGPLGTIAGVYETALEKLCERVSEDGHTIIRPKIVASTATVRRASQQIQALFGRESTFIFPPPGVNRQDSFFAKTVAVQEGLDETNGRLYVGIAAQGRSLKKVFLHACLAIMGRAQALYKEDPKAADTYMTLLGYFNNLRELGGSLRLVQDQVLINLEDIAKRSRLDPPETLFADRKIDMLNIRELTSRVATAKVSETKHLMGQPHGKGEQCDVVLATNMISVGMDVTRLGLMMVLSQPKGSSEYIQATSRVGRDARRPGLVITLLNPHRPRDRSHYEQFQHYHECFYRSVEATSVTPFSPKALDRALAACLVSLVRYTIDAFTAATGAQRILDDAYSGQIDELCKHIANRAKRHRNFDTSSESEDEIYDHILRRCRMLIDDWKQLATTCDTTSSFLQYHRETDDKAALPLIHQFLDPTLQEKSPEYMNFRANRSMRDVESTTELRVDVITESARELNKLRD